MNKPFLNCLPPLCQTESSCETIRTVGRTLAEFLSTDKDLRLSATRSGLVGRYLTMLDLKTSCRASSASVRWTKTICRSSRALQPIRKCHESRQWNRRHLDFG